LIILILSYLKYLLKAGDEHSVHSPFVFDLYYRAIKSRDGRYLQLVRVEPPDANAPKRIQNNPEHIQSIESLRETLKSDSRTIEITELGAGSKIHAGNQRKISDLSNTAQKPTKYAQLLARLVAYFQPSTILDLGTSLGLNHRLYGIEWSKCKVYSFEDVHKQLQLLKKIWQNWASIMFQSSKEISTIRFKKLSVNFVIGFYFCRCQPSQSSYPFLF
jgi:hypothetical protein